MLQICCQFTSLLLIIKLKEGDLDSAKLYFQRAKNMGLTKKYLTRYEMDEDTFSEFESELKLIGEIE